MWPQNDRRAPACSPRGVGSDICLLFWNQTRKEAMNRETVYFLHQQDAPLERTTKSRQLRQQCLEIILARKCLQCILCERVCRMNLKFTCASVEIVHCHLALINWPNGLILGWLKLIDHDTFFLPLGQGSEITDGFGNVKNRAFSGSTTALHKTVEGPLGVQSQE